MSDQEIRDLSQRVYLWAIELGYSETSARKLMLKVQGFLVTMQ